MSDRAADEIAADVGQLLWLGFEGLRPSDQLRRDLRAGRAGAVILFRRNLPGDPIDIHALVALTDELHQCAPAAGPPLWIAIDQEGGRVQRVRAPAPRWPAMLSIGEDPARCRQIGLAMGRELAALGFDIDFAPVLDVHTNEDNPVIGDRAFARTPESAAAAALAFAEGLEQAGIIACGKHFPGHGDTDADSHLMLPRLDHDLERLHAIELLPFRRAIAARIPMIMTAHVIFAALDARVPATLSPRVMTGLLRDELGFAGIVVSDDLDMRAIAAHHGIGEAAVQAVRAGCDALLLCRDQDHQQRARESLIRAAQSDSQVRARVARSAQRIRAAKRAHAERERAPANASQAMRLFSEHAKKLAHSAS